MEAFVQEPGFFEGRRRSVIAAAVTLLVIIAITATVVLINRKKEAAGTKEGVAAAAKGQNGDKEKTPVPVSATAAAVAPVSSYISATANLVAEQEVKIVAETEGRIARLMVDEGVNVRAGQPLATLVSDDAEIALAKATVRATNAEVAYERAREMMTKDLLSKGDYDKAVLEKEVAKQEVAEARWLLGKTTIRAPFDGRLTDRVVNQGQHLNPGDTLFTVTDFDPLIARLYLPEKDVLALAPGKEVRIRLKASNEVVVKGRIRQIADVVDPATGTVKVTVEAVNPPAAVRSGAFVTIDIVRETRANAVVIPRESVVHEMRDAHVFIANGNVARKRAVTLGLEDGDVVQVLSGVNAGDRIINAGQGGLKDGSAIKVMPPS